MDLDSLSRLFLMALGIGLVIFVHELGHFVAARLCKVRVEVFSLGFGPKLLGWTRGDTLYQLALLPLGGYCRMAGEDPGDGSSPKPYELRAKRVEQRFFIYSGGVLMNVVFGFAVLPVILFWGVPFDQPLIGSVEPGSPAWHARLEPGTRIVSVNGTEMVGFEYIASEIALGSPERTDLVVLPPHGAAQRTVTLKPRYDKELGLPTIGIDSATDPDHAIEVLPDSPAARAGLRSGDRIVSVAGAIAELPIPEQLALAMSRGGAVRVGVRGAGEEDSVREVSIEPERGPKKVGPMLGIGAAYNRVSDLRANPDLAALGLQIGDRVVSVNGVRLLRQRDLERALLGSEAAAHFDVEREGARMELALPALDRSRALALASDVALEIDRSRVEVVLLPGSAAERAGLLDGDRIVSVDGVGIAGWEEFQELSRAAGADGRSLRLDITREGTDGSAALVTISATPAEFEELRYGIALRKAMYVYRAGSVPDAIRVGVRGAWKFVTDAWLMLQRMLLGDVSSRNMGGIISIGVVSYSWAGVGLPKLLFFLCMLSLNLAFINILPVPVLDGGHLLFLAVEKIKGSPVSQRVLGYSQTVGLVLILTLLIYVTYWDVRRWGGYFFDL